MAYHLHRTFWANDRKRFFHRSSMINSERSEKNECCMFMDIHLNLGKTNRKPLLVHCFLFTTFIFVHTQSLLVKKKHPIPTSYHVLLVISCLHPMFGKIRNLFLIHNLWLYMCMYVYIYIFLYLYLFIYIYTYIPFHKPMIPQDIPHSWCFLKSENTRNHQGSLARKPGNIS